MLWGGVAVTFLLWRPQHDGFMRYGLILALAIVWTGLLMTVWRRKGARFAVMGLPLMAVLPFLMPGRPLDQPSLRENYIAGMRSFIGTTYVWGGESSRGIDCSGLPRKALRDALMKQAVHGNGDAARLWLTQWWYDASAKAMKESYRGFTRPTGVEGGLRQLDPAKLEGGDLAVTENGRHVMIYLGDGEWIQADPGPGRVLVAKPNEDENPWFDSRVSVHRWTVLAGPE